MKIKDLCIEWLYSILKAGCEIAEEGDRKIKYRKLKKRVM